MRHGTHRDASWPGSSGGVTYRATPQGVYQTCMGMFTTWQPCTELLRPGECPACFIATADSSNMAEGCKAQSIDLACKQIRFGLIKFWLGYFRQSVTCQGFWGKMPLHCRANMELSTSLTGPHQKCVRLDCLQCNYECNGCIKCEHFFDLHNTALLISCSVGAL